LDISCQFVIYLGLLVGLPIQIYQTVSS